VSLRHLFSGALPTPWRSVARARTNESDEGFTLIELIIVSLILPIIIGAITLALVAIFSTQGSVTNRLSDSGDAQVVSTNFEKDVQSAAYLTTNTSSTSPAPCETSAQVSAGATQVLGFEWGGGATGTEQTEVSYIEVSGTPNSLARNVCQIGSTTPTSTIVISHNVPTGQTANIACAATLTSALTSGTTYAALNVSPLPLAVSASDSVTVSSGGTSQSFSSSGTASNAGSHVLTVGGQAGQAATQNFPVGSQVVDSSWMTPPGITNCGAGSAWISTASVTGVTLSIVNGGGSKYSYQLVALPGASSPASEQSTVATPNSSCGFANAGTGTYASELCFVDFSPYSQTPVTCPGSPGYQQISAPIATTPYTLTFCLKVTGTAVQPFIIPTYFAPPTSEAFLGNNGFYTGIAGDPALYQTGGGTTNASIIEIQVLDSNGNPATGWELATGDAESTDQGESMVWTAGWSAQSDVPTAQQVLTLLPNSQNSPYGNACAYPGASYSDAPAGVDLQGLGTTSVTCGANVSSDKTGTVMLEAPAPSSLSVTMVGSGLEAMFIGLLLP
jgi:prepilin-type N-terminal cleavage/methylation domain-containing protein